MRFLISLLFLLHSCLVLCQDAIVAKKLYQDGAFKKALVLYTDLYQKSSYNTGYLKTLVAIHQQLEQYQEAEEILLKAAKKPYAKAIALTELSYLYQITQQPEKAKKHYQKALKTVLQEPHFTYSVASTLESHALLEQALEVLDIGIAHKPHYNYYFTKARIYAEQGNIHACFSHFCEAITLNTTLLPKVIQRIAPFITSDPSNKANSILKKIAIKKLQKQPELHWNKLLSWLFVQQNQIDSAFRQEKAIYKQDSEASLARILELLETALEKEQNTISQDILAFIIKNTQQTGILLQAKQTIISFKIKEKQPAKNIDKDFKKLFKTYGVTKQTLALQLQYAHFLCFYSQNPKQAIAFLTPALAYPLSSHQKAQILMQLADIHVYDSGFNQALLYYTKIQKLVKNSDLSQQARFKVAKTSYYKGDFSWAKSQCKVLKASTSQLIANDALALQLLLGNNTQDSVQTALQLFAKADFYSYQNKTEKAKNVLLEILEKHKTTPIEDDALLRYAKLAVAEKQYTTAKKSLDKILLFYPDSILIDDTLYLLAQVLELEQEIEKAQLYYEKIIINHPDSIYFALAKKQYKALEKVRQKTP